MSRYRTILFDVDGTLIHSQPGIIHTMEYTFRTMGVDPAGINLNQYLGPPLRKSFSNHFETPEKVEEAVELYRRRYAQVGQHECSLFPGCKEMLQELSRAGYTLCTATCKPVPVVTPILEELGIRPYFNIVGGASVDQSVDNKTAVIRLVLDQLDRRDGVLMVGDRRDDMEGAHNCGLPALGALYGYAGPGELDPYHPVACVNSCQEVLDYIISAN